MAIVGLLSIVLGLFSLALAIFFGGANNRGNFWLSVLVAGMGVVALRGAWGGAVESPAVTLTRMGMWFYGAHVVFLVAGLWYCVIQLPLSQRAEFAVVLLLSLGLLSELGRYILQRLGIPPLASRGRDES